MFAPLLAMLLIQAAAPPDNLAAAEAALEAGKYADAAATLEKITAADPKDYRARFNLAFAYTELQRNAEAIEQYTNVVEQQPDLAPARLNLGILLLRGKKPADAAPHLQVAAEKKPQDLRAHLYLGEALLGSGAPDRAETAYRKAAEIDPRSASAALGLGRALARQGQIDAAREQYLHAAKLDPQFRDALLELGDVLEQKQQPAQALDLYLEFLKSAPDSVAVNERAGVLLLQQKRYSEAIEHLEAAARQNPTAANQAALAQGYVMTKQLDKAIPLLRAAIAADPGSPDLRFRLATALLEIHEYDGASREFFAVTEKQPNNLEAWNGLGLALYKMENPGGAMKALDRARQLGREPPGNHFLRAIILDKAQQYPAALESYEKFLAGAAGKYPDDEFKARQRVRIITNILKKRR